MNDGFEDDSIGGLIAAGFIVAIGYGIYRIIKSFSGYRKGEEVDGDQLLSNICDTEADDAGQSQIFEEGYYCSWCGDFQSGYDYYGGLCYP
jgi:hypothetical protein